MVSTARRDRRTGGRRLPHGAENGHRLFEGAAAEGAAQSPAGADRAGHQQPLPQAGHAARSCPADVGSTDANIAVSMGIPAVAVGAVVEHMPHRLEEYAEASSIVPGIKSLIALAVALTSH